MQIFEAMIKSILIFLCSIFISIHLHAGIEKSQLLMEHGNFRPMAEVVPHTIYRGARPQSEEDYELLRTKRIKTILNLGVLPQEKTAEESMAKKYAMKVISVFIVPSPITNSDKTIEEALQILRDPANYPIYVHCRYGRDRTSLVVGLYSLTSYRLSLRDTWEEMKYYGFNKKFHIEGLYHYFRNYVNFKASPLTIQANEKILSDESVCGGVDLDDLKDHTAQACLDAVHHRKTH